MYYLTSYNSVNNAYEYKFISQNTSSETSKIVIFDWDDTLFPTTAIICKEEVISAQQMREFGKMKYELLQKYILIYGVENIFIITNAMKKWVYKSLKDMSDIYKAKTINNEKLQALDYFAAIYNSLISLKINVISAQDLYSKRYPQKYQLWKTLTFKDIIARHFKFDSIHNNNNNYLIISIGDSDQEFIASFKTKYILDQQYKLKENSIKLHRVKLKHEPSIIEMMKQMQLLIDKALFFNVNSHSITIKCN